MLDRILVPLEGSTLAECVLPHAKAIAQSVGAHLMFLHVLEQEISGKTNQVDPLNWYLRKVEAQSYMDQVSQQWQQSGLPITNVLLEGPAAERVVEYAHDHNVDLVVLSNQSQSGVAQKVIWQVYKSIMLVRAEWPAENSPDSSLDEMRYGRILIPLDGSLRAESVLPIATRLAQSHQAELLLVHVTTRPEMVQPHALTPEDSALLEQITQRNLSAATNYLEHLQLRLPPEAQTRLLVSDNVIASLHNLVEQEKADLVIMSAHGHSGGSQRPYGNVVTNFITYGSVPLLIIQDMPSPRTGSLSLGNANRSFSDILEGQPFASANYAH
ncbi:MAG: universal stress protein [Chloroflexota bacterium]|jgi:nucleotide-binding universal stress UspA family protein